MGLIKLGIGAVDAAIGAVGGVLADQWKEFFYCDSLSEGVLAVKGQKRVTGRSANTKGEENIITSGSVVAVADGQALLVVDQGLVIDVCLEPGEYVFDSAGEPSIFAGGSLSENLKASLLAAWERFKFGGIPGKDIRVYFFNTKELIGNKYGTPNPVPFRIVDQNIGLDIDVAIRCHGEYSYRLVNPILFYQNVCGNVADSYKRETLDSQLKSELLNALQPAFAKLSALGIRYSALPGHTMELSDALNEVLSEKWRDLRGIEVVSFGVSSVTANEEDEQMIKNLQKAAVMRDPSMAAAALIDAQAEAMKAAANNDGGAMQGFIGMGMAQQAGGVNAADLFAMGQAQGGPQSGMGPASPPVAPGGGYVPQAAPPPAPPVAPPPAAPAAYWACACGFAQNAGAFCANCGQPKPVAPAPMGCPRCGWTPDPSLGVAKFCPECGTPLAAG